ncbi:MAG: PAS domain-containing protein [Bilophila sp.]
MRIDLDTGHYTIPYGAYLAHANLPLRGDYDAMLRHCFSIYVSEDEREELFDRICLAALEAAWREGWECSREYRVSDGRGSFVWVRSRFFFTRSGGKRLCYKTISDVTENRRDREGGRLAALYDFALRDEPGEIYEINLTRRSFRTLRRNPLFLPLPDQGSLDFLRAEAGAMMHPEDRARFAGFLTLADAARDGEPLCEKFRCRWRDGEYYWVAVNVLAVEESEEKVRLACVMAAKGAAGALASPVPTRGGPGAAPMRSAAASSWNRPVARSSTSTPPRTSTMRPIWGRFSTATRIRGGCRTCCVPSWSIPPTGSFSKNSTRPCVPGRRPKPPCA